MKIAITCELIKAEANEHEVLRKCQEITGGQDVCLDVMNLGDKSFLVLIYKIVV